MGRHTFRLPDYQSEGLETTADVYDMTMSDVARIAFNRMLEDDPTEGEVPDWVQKEAVHDEITTENNPNMRQLHFKQNVYEYLAHECLRGEDGDMARFPPSPERVEADYLDSMREEVKRAFPENHREEALQHLDRMGDWYELVHPETQADDKEAWLRETVLYLLRWQDEDAAREWLDRQDRKGLIPDRLNPHQLLDDARDEYHANRWKDEYDDAARGKL